MHGGGSARRQRQGPQGGQQRLAALLDNSRKFQNEVSEKLAEQVLHALYEFLRGFQAAHDASRGELLRKPLSEHPDEVYRAVAFLLWRNEIIPDTLVVNAQTLPRVVMPARQRFVPDNRRGGAEIR